MFFELILKKLTLQTLRLLKIGKPLQGKIIENEK